MYHYKTILRTIGVLLLLVGSLMLSCIIVSFVYESQDWQPLLLSGGITMGVGGLLMWLGRHSGNVFQKRDGYLVVSIGWFAMTLFGMLPFVLSGEIPHVINAWFETMSGMTTTGASVLTDIEAVSKGILFWRSMTQWIGGMGIIVLTVAILPLLGIGGIELFVAEAPGPTSDKIHPRIRETAKRLWYIYVGLTLLLFILLKVAGMTYYDALNHALTTMATGGFSTKNASMAYYSPTIQYIVTVFMILAGTNYTVLYFGLQGKLRKVWKFDEFRVYLGLLLLLFLAYTVGIHQHTDAAWEQSFRDGSFQVASLITTTGFVSADYTGWGNGLFVVSFALLFTGACAGSTSGGIKLIRHLVFARNSLREFKRILHPKAVIYIKINKEVVPPRILTHILVFLLIYMITFIIGALIVSMLGLDFETALGATATSLGNVGPGIGKVGPVDNFAWLGLDVKLVLAFLMLLGRLELFTVLVLFTPYYWKVN